ncbi:hypothetical protein BD410DRAFT_685926, partial [Rickenella mellea]
HVAEENFPWVVEGAEDLFIDPVLRKTRERLRIYAANPKQALRSLQGYGRPEFPESEWLNLFKGKAVDLDAVYSGLNTDHIDTRQTSEFGLVEISLRGSTPYTTRKVRDYGSWGLAYDSLMCATRLVFPERKNELQKYRDWIMRQFGATHPNFHYTVIGLDRAIRTRVSRSNDCLLTDTGRFLDLFTTCCSPTGLNYTGGTEARGTTSAKTTKSGEICRRYNDDKCPSDARTCKYRHICIACKTSGHSQNKCPK